MKHIVSKRLVEFYGVIEQNINSGVYTNKTSKYTFEEDCIVFLRAAGATKNQAKRAYFYAAEIHNYSTYNDILIRLAEVADIFSTK